MGKYFLCKLAAQISRYKLFELEIDVDYSTAHFKEDLKEILKVVVVSFHEFAST